jgi:hypothetical protein
MNTEPSVGCSPAPCLLTDVEDMVLSFFVPHICSMGKCCNRVTCFQPPESKKVVNRMPSVCMSQWLKGFYSNLVFGFVHLRLVPSEYEHFNF